MNWSITRTRRLHDARRPLNDFLETCSVLGDKLGPFLIGHSPAFKKDLERFDEFLSILPEHRFAFEFRHSSWFDDEVFARFRGQRELTLAMLGAQFDNNVEWFTDVAYIRWHARGRKGDGYSPSEIDYWARRIREISQGADVFGYWNNDAYGYAPQNCDAKASLTLRSSIDRIKCWYDFTCLGTVSLRSRLEQLDPGSKIARARNANSSAFT